MPLFGTDGEPLTGNAMFQRLRGGDSDARFKITIEIPNDPELRKAFSDPLLNPFLGDLSSITDDAGRIFGEVIGNFATSREPIFRSNPLNLLVFESLPEPADPELFTDGFESGETSAWTTDLVDGFNASGFFPDASDPGDGTSESLRSSALRFGAQNPLIPIADATASIAGQFDAIYAWDAETQSYLSFRTGALSALNSLQELRAGQAVFINITDPEGALWAQGPALTAARDLPLVARLQLRNLDRPRPDTDRGRHRRPRRRPRRGLHVGRRDTELSGLPHGRPRLYQQPGRHPLRTGRLTPPQRRCRLGAART